MGDDLKINATIQKTLDLAARCTQAETSDNYGILGDEVEALEGQARETFQSKMGLVALLQKLRAVKPLTPEDLKTLELLIVGDAESFLKYETEFDHWKTEIKQLIGRGGMAEVYRAHNPDLKQDVAIKVLHSEALDSDGAT